MISRCLFSKPCKLVKNERDKGFTLIEMMISLTLTGLILTLGISLWMFGWKAMDQETFIMQSLDDEWVLYHALTQDLTCSTRVNTDGSFLTVNLSDGEVATYGFSPISHLILRTLNGNGEVVVSTNVDRVSWQVVNNELHATIDYDNEGKSYEAELSLTPNITSF